MKILFMKPVRFKDTFLNIYGERDSKHASFTHAQ